jgi:hypothetical protein
MEVSQDQAVHAVVFSAGTVYAVRAGLRAKAGWMGFLGPAAVAYIGGLCVLKVRDLLTNSFPVVQRLDLQVSRMGKAETDLERER